MRKLLIAAAVTLSACAEQPIMKVPPYAGPHFAVPHEEEFDKDPSKLSLTKAILYCEQDRKAAQYVWTFDPYDYASYRDKHALDWVDEHKPFPKRITSYFTCVSR